MTERAPTLAPSAASRGRRDLDRLVPTLLLLTGMAGLVYEVVFARLLAQHLGSSGSSQAVTLAAFLGGLALGAALADRALPRVLQRVQQPILVYAALEGAVGLWALLFTPVADGIFGLVAPVLNGVAPDSLAAVATKLAVAALLILPLTVAMGATLPVLAAGVQRLDPSRGVWLVSRYYYLNAAGAAFGALLAGFVLIERFGLELPLTLGALVNLGVAFAAWWVLRSRGAAPARAPSDAESADPAQKLADSEPSALPVQPPPAAAPATPPRLRWLVVALLTGAVALQCEVLWTRLASLLLGASTYSFALMLTVAIAGISAGSAIATRRIRGGADPGRVLAAAQLLAGLSTLWLLSRANPMAIELAEARVRLTSTTENYPIWLALAGGWLALHLLPAALGLGAAFPSLLAAAQQDGARTDKATAQILLANTCGNLLGALGGGFGVMPLLGVEGTLGLAGAVSLAIGVAVLPRPWGWRTIAWPAAALMALGLWMVGHPVADFALTRGLFRLRASSAAEARIHAESLREVAQVLRSDGRDATIVVDKYPNGILMFRTNGKADGSTGDVTTQVMLGHLGMLLHPAARDALVVGLGTGQTAAALVSHPKVQVRVVELSPAVVEVARLFSPFNGNLLDNPRIQVTVADGREVLRALPPASLDLLVSEPSNPWVIGVADLYTRESFARMREHLRPGGVVVQWIHTYEMAEATLRSILCSLQGELPYVAVFRMDPGDLALVASAQPLALDVTAATAALEQPSVRDNLVAHHRPEVPTRLEHFLVAQLANPAHVAAVCAGFKAPLEERFPRLEYVAPRDFFAGTTAAPLVDRLDQRHDPKASLWLGEWLAGRPLDAPLRASLHQFLMAGNHPQDQALAAATAPPESLPVPVRHLIYTAPDPARLPAAQRRDWCRWLGDQVPWLLPKLRTVLGPVSDRPELTAWRSACLKLIR